MVLGCRGAFSQAKNEPDKSGKFAKKRREGLAEEFDQLNCNVEDVKERFSNNHGEVLQIRWGEEFSRKSRSSEHTWQVAGEEEFGP